jgi:hypothetical protein
MRREDLQRWAANYRAAQARERAAQVDSGPDPGLSIRHALALIAFSGRMGAHVTPRDPIERRDDEAARTAWNRLREALLRRGRPR